MGNVNYQNLMCENYYCQSVSFKPEWFSETSWTIDYKINNESLSDLGEITRSLITQTNVYNSSKISYEEEAITVAAEIKPYTINKGILIIKNTPKFDLILSKKLLLDFNEQVNFSIPINFKYHLKNPLNIYIIFSETNLDLKNINQSLFYKHLKIFKKNIFIKNETYGENNAISKKIKYNKYHKFEMILENDNNSIIIDESLYYKKKKYYNKKYVKILEYNNNTEKNLYLSIFIQSEHNIGVFPNLIEPSLNPSKAFLIPVKNNKEYIELSFD